MPDKDFLAGVVWRDLQPILDEEVKRLPAGCREAFVLCCLEGKTYEQTAQELRCRPGTISRRLARARELLQSRLARRGLVLPAGLLAAALTEQVAPAAIPARLIASTVRTARASAAGAASAIAAHIAALAEGGRYPMTTRTNVLTALTLAAGLLWAGAAALGHAQPAGQPEQAPQDTRRAAGDQQRDPVPPEQRDAKETQRTLLAGRVLDAEGKPAAGAVVALVGGLHHANRAGPQGSEQRPLVEGKAGEDGRFRLQAPLLSADRYWALYLLASAPGQGLGMQRIDANAQRHDVALVLPREEPLRGRLVDLQGQPAAGVKVQLRTVHSPADGKDSVWAHFSQLAGKPYAPGAVVSDGQGRFTLRGLGPVTEVVLRTGGEPYALQDLTVSKPRGEVTLALPPARVLEGTVTFADTGKPVPNARLRVSSQPARYELNPHRELEARTDAGGRFRVTPHSGGFFTVVAHPPEGSPYLLVNREVNWPKADAIRQEVHLKLVRGVVVRGVVTEQGSGKPVAGATVQYQPRYDSPFFKRELQPLMSSWRPMAQTGPDGKFETAVIPGPGHLFINGPTADYLHAEILTSKVYGPGVRPNRRHYPDGLVALDLAPDARTHDVKVTLRRGVTLRGRALRPDGKPVAEGALFCHTYLPRGYTLNPVSALPVRKGRFELPGFEPEKSVPVFFYDAGSKSGAVVELSAAKGEATVRLEPCGDVRVRFVDEKGKPLAGMRVFVEVPVTPGPSFFDRKAQEDYQAMGDAAWMSIVDSKRGNDQQTDAQGRVTFGALIPGARHRIVIQSTEGLGMFSLPQEFTTQAGKTLDLKEITVPTRR
jgi:uncharacterized GH25 family protein